MSKPKIYIIDVTNRDGVQTSRICLSKLEKTMINLYSNEMGVFQSEFGFPMTRHETNYLNANLELAQQKVLHPIRLNLSISTSDQMILHKFKGKLDHTSVIHEMTDAVHEARKSGAEALGVNAEDASRTKMDYLIEFSLAAKEAGADRIRYCDTLGCDTPFSIYERIKLLSEATHMPIEIHCHNDLGLVVANSIAGAKAALDSGVDAFINTCVNGMGERAGNADLISVILAIKYGNGMQDYSLDERISLKVAWKVCKYASYAFGVPIPINQPGIGANAFAHESGIHADGALKDRRNYELYDFEELGRGEPEIIETGRKITAGEYSGIKGFRNVYDKLEVAFKNEEDAARVLELVRYANVHNQKPLVDDELKFIAKHPDIAEKIFTMNP
ncbi:MAG: homocitrate synthase [Candidatus Omnitrophica bacterium]|nr:homocitrate synthase [Candidatus Omnitrophota bacterium]